MRIPFDLNYLPDLIFATNMRLSNKFPNDAGQGVLNLMFPERAFIKFPNLAHCAMIVDNYLIQFGSSGNMYILDIVNNTVDTIKVADNNLTNSFTDWIKNSGVVAVKMMQAIDRNRNAQQWVNIYLTVLCYNTLGEVPTNAYESAMNQIKMSVGLPSSSNKLRISHRQWFYDSQAMNWGAVAFNIFREYFQEFMGYGKI